MLLTEEEARKTYCPFSRVEVRHAQCLASNCMAWRRDESDAAKAQADAAYRQTGARIEINTGYCGLAGKP